MSNDPPQSVPAEWAAEHTVGVGQAAELVGRQFPHLDVAEVRLLATGWDNTVLMIDGRWAFRFPRRAVALPGIQREIAVLPRLAARLPLPVPRPELVGTPTDAYPWPFWGALLLHGRELAEARLPDSQRLQVAADIGEFLRALHDPDTISATEGLLPIDPLDRGNPRRRAGRTRERLDDLVRRRIWEPDPAVERLITDAEELGAPRDAPVVVHGDLHVRHLLVDRDCRAAGVIDWGDVCLGDPAIDLSLAYGGFTGSARAELLAAYGPIDLERELRARALAAFLCAALADYAATDGRTLLLREALAGLARIAGD